MIEKLGGTKAIGAAMTVLVAVGVVIFLRGDIPANFEHLLEIIFGTFVAGNVTNTVSSHVTGAGKDSTATIESAPAVDLSPITAELQAIKAQNETVIQALSTSQQGIGFLCSYVSQQSVATQAAANRSVISNA